MKLYELTRNRTNPGIKQLTERKGYKSCEHCIFIKIIPIFFFTKFRLPGNNMRWVKKSALTLLYFSICEGQGPELQYLLKVQEDLR